MACNSTDEIAELTGSSKADVSGVCSESATLPNLNKLERANAEHATDFDAPIYRVKREASHALTAGDGRGTGERHL